MQARTPQLRRPQAVTLGRGWLLPAVVLGLLLAGLYLPAHGVTQVFDLLAAAVAAVGLVAVSLAAPRWARRLVLGTGEPVALIGVQPFSHADGRLPVRRRIAAVGAGVAATTLATGAAALALAMIEPAAAAHAVLLIALYANVAMLFANVVPVPYWPGWTLLLALIDARPGGGQTVRRALPVARTVIAVEAAGIGVGAIAGGHWLLLLPAGLLIWHGWMQLAVAQADEAITRYLAARRVGDLARETSFAASDEPITLAIARRQTPWGVIAVQDRDGIIGAIGPRQAAAVRAPDQVERRSSDVMVPLSKLDLLRGDAPATAVQPQLDRFGFALVADGGRLQSVELHDVLQRILLSAAVAQAVHQRRLDLGEKDAEQGDLGPKHEEEIR